MVRVAGVAGAVVLGLAAVVLSVVLGPPGVARGSLLDQLRLPGAPEVDEAPPESFAEGAAPRPELDGPVLGVPVEVVLALLVTAVALALLVRSVLRAGNRPVDEPDPDEVDGPAAGAVDVAAVRAAVGDAAAGLAGTAGHDAADVVIGCWVRLEAAGGTAGSRRHASDTPTDFAHRLQDAVPGLDTEALLRLRSVYSRVRFGSDGASAVDVDTARRALADLVRTLEAAGRTGSRA